MTMDPMTLAGLGKAGAIAAIAWAAVGSALGTGTAGRAAIGAWKKCFAQGKEAPFLLLLFIGAPLSQTIYGMILMMKINGLCNLETYLAADMVAAAKSAAGASGNWLEALPADALAAAQSAMGLAAVNWPAMLSAGIFGGIAMGVSAWYQGLAGAAGADALAETGKGFGNYLMTIGVVETVALFVLVFVLISF